MKHLLKTLTASAVAMVLLIQNADAQIAMSSPSAPGSSISSGGNISGVEKDKSSLSGIHPRAIKDFEKSFKGITNEEWSKIDDGYIAKFKDDAVQTRVGYNRNGSWLNTIRYYGEKQLPHDIRDRVKSVYYDYTIFNVAEVHVNDQPVYLVYLQDDTHLKTIRIYEGEMEEVQNFTRG